MSRQTLTRFRFLLLLLPAFFASSLLIRAQSSDPFNPYTSIAPSAETSEMVRFGGLEPSLYSGAMSKKTPTSKVYFPNSKRIYQIRNSGPQIIGKR